MEMALAIYDGDKGLFANLSGWLSILGNGRDQVLLNFVVSGVSLLLI